MLSSHPRFRLALVVAAVVALVAGLVFTFWWKSPSAQVTFETIDAGGETRRYRLAVPETVPSTPLPLILVFHGIGDTPESMAAYSQLDRLAAAGKAYVVYPETRMGMWDIHKAKPEDFRENRDLPLIDRLLDRLKNQLKTDRVALVGMSNGGTFAQLAAQARSDIDLVVAHSGAKPQELVIGRMTPILLVVGTSDLVIDAVRQDASQYRAAGCTATLLEDPGLGHKWSSRFDAEIDAFLTAPTQDH
ncbi:dienelactone hydrolase family protein [Blastopirellula sp. JC732]|uniref:Dienelactone hydrolase family protein n=1 Tax=Blastopirellula sediminis TaxID=2894196 RepID=A0A9X1MKA2_9BACT|nr:alpha/beta hydrolase-fold protein [Blastopirellula sediminis]MCC9609443.1 dienelactone hydrolase family protein [Blastopirellula sediminis]MCC9627780.1 dienelactone hydrolase family protein [Blastopirellula sediminis]